MAFINPHFARARDPTPHLATVDLVTASQPVNAPRSIAGSTALAAAAAATAAWRLDLIITIILFDPRWAAEAELGHSTRIIGRSPKIVCGQSAD
jgi:hypothetical protein